MAETSRLEYVGRFYVVLSNDGDSMKYFFLVGILSLLGCQHKLFVDKRMVVREESGYVMIFKEEMAFFASKLKGTDNFLKKDHLKGIRLDKSEFGWLDSLAVDYYVYLSNGAPTDGQVKDTISILPVSFKYYLGKYWDGRSEELSLFLVHNGHSNVLRYTIYDFRNVLGITPINEASRN